MKITSWFIGFKFKMLLMVLVPSVFLVALVLMSLYVTKEIKLSASQVTDVRVPSIQGLQIMDEGKTAVKTIFFNAMINSSKINVGELQSKISAALFRYREGFNIYAPLEQTKEEADEWNKYVPLAQDWEAKINKAISLFSDSNLEAAKTFFENELNNSFLQLDIPFQRILAINYEVVVQEKAQFGKVNTQAYWMSLLFGVLGVLGTVFFGLYFGSSIAKDLSIVTDSISASSTQVSQASNSLARSAESLSSSAQEQASTIEETSTSIAMLTTMVSDNVRVAGESNSTASDMQKLSHETSSYMENLSEAMHSILESNNRIEKLVKIIEEIGGKTEIIDDIVFKTQLLSFNASVEAERAGEQGRGFAVVAQEVGNLAQMSGQAASEISSIVKNSIREAELVAKENKERVERGSELALGTKEKMVKVSSMISQIIEGTSSISAASQDQSRGLSEINLAVENISKTTQETARNAEESSSASTELSSQAESLKRLVEKLKYILTGTKNYNSENDEDRSVDYSNVKQFSRNNNSYLKAS